MKYTKRLLCSLLAMLLVFCSLSAGMTTLAAADEDAPAAIPFASLKVGDKTVKLDTNNEEYSIVNFGKTSAKLQWKLNKGWKMNSSSYYIGTNDRNYKIQNGGTIKIPKNGKTILSLVLDYGSYNYKYIFVYIYNTKARLLPKSFYMGESSSLCYEGFAGSSQVVSIKSSKPGVIAVKKGRSVNDCTLTLKKPGTSKITLVVNLNGQKKRFSAKYTVKKYPKPITELKVDGKAVNLGKDKYYAQVKVKKLKVKVKFKIAKGWKLKRCSYWDYKTRKDTALKSGGTVNVIPIMTEYADGTFVQFELKRGKEVFLYELQVAPLGKES